MALFTPKTSGNWSEPAIWWNDSTITETVIGGPPDGYFQVGDDLGFLQPGEQILVFGSDGYDGTYTLTSVAYFEGITKLWVAEYIPNGTGGYLRPLVIPRMGDDVVVDGDYDIYLDVSTPALTSVSLGGSGSLTGDPNNWQTLNVPSVTLTSSFAVTHLSAPSFTITGGEDFTLAHLPDALSITIATPGYSEVINVTSNLNFCGIAINSQVAFTLNANGGSFYITSGEFGVGSTVVLNNAALSGIELNVYSLTLNQCSEAGSPTGNWTWNHSGGGVASIVGGTWNNPWMLAEGAIVVDGGASFQNISFGWGDFERNVDVTVNDATFPGSVTLSGGSSVLHGTGPGGRGIDLNVTWGFNNSPIVGDAYSIFNVYADQYMPRIYGVFNLWAGVIVQSYQQAEIHLKKKNLTYNTMSYMPGGGATIVYDGRGGGSGSAYRGT